MRGETARSGGEEHAIRIISPKGGVGLVVVFAGAIRGCFTHYHLNRSCYCPGEGRCHPSIHRLRTDWKGYAPVYQWHEGPNVYIPDVLEVTANLDLQLQGRDLVGENWLISRDTSKKKNGPVSGDLLGRTDQATLQVWFDPLPALQWLWPQTEILLGVPNPLRSRPVMPIIAALRPASTDPRPQQPPKRRTEAELSSLREKVAAGGFVGSLANRVLEEQSRFYGNGDKPQ